MKKKILIIGILIAVLFAIILINNNVYATSTYSDSINPDDFHTDITVNTSGSTIAFVKKILGVINVIGAVVLVATVALLGIKYVAGSLEERAEYKKSMIPIIIGAFLLFSTSTIINIVYSIMNNI